MAQHLGGRKICKKKKVGLKQSYTFWRRFAGVVPMFGLAFLIAFLASSVFTPINASNAAETTITANVSFGSYSLTLSVSPNVTLNVAADPTGVMSVGSTTVTTNTTSPSGYKLYLGMNSADNKLHHSTNNNAWIDSVNGTYTDASELDTNSTWGYAIENDLTKNPYIADSTNVDFDDTYTPGSSITPTSNKFAAVPPNTMQPQLLINRTIANTTPDNLTVFYGVRASYATPTGTYSNQVQYTAIADGGASHGIYVTPEQTPAIDGGDTLTVTTTLQSTASTIDTDVYLLTDAELAAVHNNTPVETYAAKKMTCSRVTPADTLTLSCTNIAAPIGMYNIYVDVPDYGESYEKAYEYVANFYNITTMQEMTNDICNDTRYVTTPSASIFNGTNADGVTGTATHANNANLRSSTYYASDPNNVNKVPETTLRDSRNNETYTVRKLADGNCWMTENLRLELTANQQLDSTTTDLPSNTTATVGLTTQPYNQASTNRYDWGVASTSDFTRANLDRWLSRSTKKNGVWATETTPSQSDAPASSDLTGEDQKEGVYYNWFAATAGTGTFDISTAGVEATGSVCPAGWHLPRYSAVDGTSNTAPSGSWENLIRDVYKITKVQGDQSTVTGGNAYANNTLHGFPLSLPYSGLVHWQSGATITQGTYGLFWSAGATSQTDARSLHFNGTGVWPELNNYRLYGFSVRCVAK